jgi:Zn-dependent protease with chaperone function
MTKRLDKKIAQSSGAVLLTLVLRGFFEGLIVGAIVCALIMAGTLLSGGAPLSYWIYGTIIVLFVAAVLYKRVSIWREATFRVTTERILISNPFAFFHAPLITIKWPQYQECEVDHRHFFDIFFLARPLKIRYGTADARYEAHFPSLRYAEDLKHYIDKVDAAIRNRDTSSLKPFVAKPRGKRDSE